MSTNTIVCFACRGQKEAPGMGGIIKKCEKCSGKGRVERPAAVLQVAKPAEPIERVAQTADMESVFETKAKPKRKSRAKVKAVEVDTETKDMFQDTVSLAQIVTGEAAKMPAVDEFTKAILDEPRMTPDEWQAKYKHIARLFGINPMTQKFDCLVTQVQRAAIRANYAATQPRVARKVNVKKAQDVVAESDAEYIAYQHQQEAREAQANAE